jgi:dienelactone hydrolase
MQRYLRGLVAIAWSLALPVWAKTWVNVPYLSPQGGSATVEAVLRKPTGSVPAQFMQQFARRPLLILAGAKDHYDGQDPQACPGFVAAVSDPEQAKLIQVKVYPDATHGWDHGKTYAFPVRGGCVGRSNCRNENVSSPETTQQGQADLMGFFSQPN